MLPFDRAAPLSGEEADIFVHWAGGQPLGDVPVHAGLQWPISVGVAELMRLPPNAAPPSDVAAALRRVYQGEYDYDTMKGGFKGRGHGATRGASVSISVRAVRRADKHVVTLLDKAPLVLSYTTSEFENDGLYFVLQHHLPQAICLDDNLAVGPYVNRDFPLRNLCVQACAWPADADVQGLAQPDGWRLGLEFFLQDYGDLKDAHTVAATPGDMLGLLSHANWQRA